MTLTSQDTVAAVNVNSFATPDSMNYERRGFEKDGNILSSNVLQMIKDTNEYATNKTKLIDVAGVETFDDLSGNETKFLLVGKDSMNPSKSFNVEIKLSNDALTGSTFTTIGIDSDLDGNDDVYTIYDANGNKTQAKNLTYQQLSDVISMVTASKLPAITDTFTDYETAIQSSKDVVEVGLDYQGKLEIHDKFNSQSPIEFSMFDSNANNSQVGSSLTFMANDAVKIEDPNIDFFKDLDQMIEAVRSGTFRIDSDSDNPRNIGIQNSLSRIDHIMTHITKEHTKIGSYSNALSQANERSELLSINVQTVRSEVIDVDIGEAYMKFNQLSNSYQAMLSTAAKINSMSLLNYM
jgi:flagellar hook-associated protein 3 FlgL